MDACQHLHMGRRSIALSDSRKTLQDPRKEMLIGVLMIQSVKKSDKRENIFVINNTLQAY